MFLKHLSLLNFKNHEELQFNFSPAVNCFVGNNGAGKTNILDAIYYLSFCKSYFNPIDSQNIKHEAPFFVIQGTYQIGNSQEDVYCGLKRNQKKVFKRNQKEYERLADHIGLIPLVIISPYDSNLITEGSEDRRKFIDSVISQYNKVYLDQLISYNKILQQRNVLLKQFAEQRYFDTDTIEIFNMQLIALGNYIYTQRKEFIARFTPLFQKYYLWISGSKETVRLDYTSQLHDMPYEQGLTESIAKDRAIQYTSFGIHKDDIDFLIHDNPVKKFGSQGQQKSFLIALKLAQFEILKETFSDTPILLLDDIYDKLDESRILKLMELVTTKLFSQLFITDTHKDRIQRLFQQINTVPSIFEISS